LGAIKKNKKTMQKNINIIGFGVILLLLIGFVFLALDNATLKQNNRQIKAFSDAYKAELIRLNDLFSMSLKQIDSIKFERASIVQKVELYSRLAAENESRLKLLTNNLVTLKKELHENKPNYSDSTIYAIDRVLPR
jgi:CHASE3 domain sensor protein